MSDMLVISKVGYEETRKIVDGLRTLARDEKEKVPIQYWSRLHSLASHLAQIMFDDVSIVTDAPPDLTEEEAREAIDGAERSHVNLEEGVI